MIVFDLDGTLALDHHRKHFLERGEKDWEAYFAACVDDEPNHPLLGVLRCISCTGNTVGIWSGRSDSVEKETMEWLNAHRVLPFINQVRLRDAADRTADTDLKRMWLREQQQTNDPVTLVFEDRARVVAMWREEGIVCCQVAPGEF